MDKISVVIPVKNETKKSVTMVYDYYGTVRCAWQVMRVCGNIVGFTDAGLHPCEKMVGEFGQ